jgi:hypothetical protein
VPGELEVIETRGSIRRRGWRASYLRALARKLEALSRMKRRYMALAKVENFQSKRK